LREEGKKGEKEIASEIEKKRNIQRERKWITVRESIF
jgi:hypothetical protein